MARTKRPSPHYPLLFRPFALAYRPASGWATALCLVFLGVIFVANDLTPVRVVFTSLGLVPVIAAMWLLSDRQAALVGLVAVVVVALSGLVGAVDPVTAAAQFFAFVAIALLVRMYASWMSEVLVGLQQRRRGPLQAALRLAWPTDRRPVGEAEGLTIREHQVAELAVQGYTAREMADALSIGERTVESHLANVYAKLGVRSKLELVRFAARLGLRAEPEASSENAKDG
ncbi:MAG: helix-turn-helix transcriptional regulator [Candidatus Dormibacter sp.]